jgi:hypothetical protein
MSEVETQPAPRPETSAALVEACARAAHEINRAYCDTLGEAQPSWEAAPDWQKNSARNGARDVLEGRAVTPRAQHELWLAEKRAEGWIYGEVKDAEKRTHPCLCEYDDLPLAQRAKDHLFRAVVFLIAEIVGN